MKRQECTPEEIEAKRRKAQEKLAQRSKALNSPLQARSLNSHGNALPNSNARFNFKTANSPVKTAPAFSSGSNGASSAGNGGSSASVPFSFKATASSPMAASTNNGGSPSHGYKFGQKDSASKPYDKSKEVLQFYGKDAVVRVVCTLISEERFSAEMSSFSTPCIEIFKTIPSKKYGKLFFGRPFLINFSLHDFILDFMNLLCLGTC